MKDRIYETKGTTPYTERDAELRVLDARVSSLDRARINLDYLLKLKYEISMWKAAVNEALEEEIRKHN